MVDYLKFMMYVAIGVLTCGLYIWFAYKQNPRKFTHKLRDGDHTDYWYGTVAASIIAALAWPFTLPIVPVAAFVYFIVKRLINESQNK